MFRLYNDITAGRVQANGLRFNRTYITVSELAQQLYCEHKIDLAHREGKIETEEKAVGAQIHEEIFQGKSVTIDDIIDLLLSRDRLLFTMPIAIVYKDVPVVGIPDAILSERGTVTAVIELKTTARWLEKIFMCEYFQANLYAYILNSWNLTSRDCKIIIVKILRRDIDALLNKHNILKTLIRKVEKILDLSYSEYFVAYRHKNIAIHCVDFDKVTVERYLDWALGYWRGMRPALIPSSKRRCMKCEYRHLCEYYNEKSFSVDRYIRDEEWITTQQTG